MPEVQSVIGKLRTIFDPEIPVNIYDLGLIYEIRINEQDLVVIMTLTTASCPAAAFLPEEVIRVLNEIAGIGKVQVEVVYEPKWTREKMNQAARQQLGFV